MLAGTVQTVHLILGRVGNNRYETTWVFLEALEGT